MGASGSEAPAAGSQERAFAIPSQVQWSDTSRTVDGTIEPLMIVSSVATSTQTS